MYGRTFEGENFRVSVQNENFAVTIFFVEYVNANSSVCY